MSMEKEDLGVAQVSAKISQKVMIVEDNDLNMKLFHDLLEAHGIDTIQVRDGRQVLPLAREHSPDLILMDIQLSVFPSGCYQMVKVRR